MNSISPQLQDRIAQFQQLQQQIQNVTAQRMQMESQLRETRHTSEQLASAEGAVYRSSGGVMFEVKDRKALADELEERIETLEIRVRGLSKQETSLRENAESLGKAINAAMGGPAPENGDRHIRGRPAAAGVPGLSETI